MAGTRKVTVATCGAFIARTNLTQGNTHTDGQALYLFGNKIAEHRADGTYITSADHNTTTTRERLNGLVDSVHTQKGQLYLNGEPWDGEWTKI